MTDEPYATFSMHRVDRLAREAARLSAAAAALANNLRRNGALAAAPVATHPSVGPLWCLQGLADRIETDADTLARSLRNRARPTLDGYPVDRPTTEQVDAEKWDAHRRAHRPRDSGPVAAATGYGYGPEPVTLGHLFWTDDDGNPAAPPPDLVSASPADPAVANAPGACAFGGDGSLAVSGTGPDAIAASGRGGVAVTRDGSAVAGEGGVAVVLGEGRAAGSFGALLVVRGVLGLVVSPTMGWVGALEAGVWYHERNGALVAEE